MNICKKCEYYRLAVFGYYGQVSEHRCNHKDVRQWKLHPVTGDPFFVMCSIARSDGSPCGPDGKLYVDELIVPQEHRNGFIAWLSGR